MILFGSRSREGWTDRSDIDIMVITPEQPTQAYESRIAVVAKKVLGRTYVESPAIDLVLLSAEQYRKRSKSINNVAAIASREGNQIDSESRRLRRARGV